MTQNHLRNDEEKRGIFSEVYSESVYRIALTSTLIFIPAVFAFLWRVNISFGAEIDAGKFGTFGDFIGGVLGSIWSLCGVLLFYSALKEQRKDARINSHALQQQIEALKLQSEEFKLQRTELELSRRVFLGQSQTLRQQRLESTYFSLLGLLRSVREAFDRESDSGNYFKKIRSTLSESFTMDSTPRSNHEESKKIYREVYYQKKEELNHYYQTVYQILNVIDDAEISALEKFKYLKILRSQLSENELLVLYYHSHTPYGEDLYNYFLQYNILKLLPTISKLEFTKYVVTQEQLSLGANRDATLINSRDIIFRCSKINQFNEFVFKVIRNYLNDLSVHLSENRDSEDPFRISLALDHSDGYTLSLVSSECHELRLAFFNTSLKSKPRILGYTDKEFVDYFKRYLYDIFVFSRYEEYPADDFIETKTQDNSLTFNLRFKHKLQVNCDPV